MKTLAWWLAALAAVRLGIIGFFGYDLVGTMFGSPTVTMSGIDRVVCAVVGVAGIYAVYLLLTRGSNRQFAEK